MAADDYAIIVGIKYADQGLNTLKGPENDARSFYEWVVSPAGGGVPDDDVHRKLILSSKFNDAIEPTSTRVIDAFKELDAIALSNSRAKRPTRIGRRLYIYLAGHGFAPANHEDETALLVADAKFGEYHQHILGRYCADWAYKARYFDEVILFMDCCRTPLETNPILNRKPDEVNADGYEKVMRLYCFASHWSYNTREKQMPPDNQWHGVFTTALLQGLNGAASDYKGRVTADSLYRYLMNFMQCFLTDAERADRSIPKEPDIFVPLGDAKRIILSTNIADKRSAKEKLLGFFSVLGFTPPPLLEYSVTIKLPEDAAGEELEILDKDLKRVKSLTVGQTEREWKLKLEPGFYMVKRVSISVGNTFTVGCPIGDTVNVNFEE